jgi:hypothetical protein
MELIQYIFSSFWIWLGTLILLVAPLAVLGNAIAETINARKK